MIPPTVFLLFVGLAVIQAANTAYQKCSIGRHTFYQNNQIAGSCMQTVSGGTLATNPLGPGTLFGAALNDYTGDGFEFQNSTSCGTCYQITGIGPNPVVVMVTDHCPDCPTLQPHFDLTPEAAAQIDLTQRGFTPVSFRRVSCGFTGNVLVQMDPKSKSTWLRLNIGRHNVQLAPTIQVQPAGATTWTSVLRTRASFFDVTLPGGNPYPVQVKVSSIFGDVIQFTVPRVLPNWQVIDTGKQFPDPPAGTNGAQPQCAQCSNPLSNNGQTIIYDEGPVFPEQVGQWLPLTSAAWRLYSGTFTPVSTPPPFQGQFSGQMPLAAWGIFHIGTPYGVPKSQVAAVTFAVRTLTGTGSLTVGSGPGPQAALPTVTTTWQVMRFEVANNPAVPDIFKDFQMQNVRVPVTYLFDAIKFVFAASNDQCSPWLTPSGVNPNPTTAAIVAPTTTAAAAVPTTTVPTTVPTTATTKATTAQTTAAQATTAQTTVAQTTVAQTTVAQTTVARTTAAQGTTGQTTAAQTTAQTTAAPTTTAATQAGGPTTTTAAAAVTTQAVGGAPPTQSPCPRTCCNFATNVPADLTAVTLRLDYNFADFDCANFLPILASNLKLQASDIFLTGCVAGSVVVTFSATAANANQVASNVANGNVGTLPVLAAQVGGTTVNPGSSSVPWWVILVAVLGGLVLIALIVIIVVLIVRHKKEKDKSQFFGIGLEETSQDRLLFNRPSSTGIATPTPAPRVFVSTVPPPGNRRMRILYNVVDKGDSILQLQQGAEVFVTSEDLQTPGDWGVGYRCGDKCGRLRSKSLPGAIKKF